MTDDFDFYDLLDVADDASQDEIKTAFREQVRVYHPDLNDDDRAQAQFTAVKKAYDILGDPVERRAYDRLGHEDYVAKRTSGLPSPDLWKRPDDTSSSTSGETGATSGGSQSRTTTSSASRSTSRSRTTGTDSGSRDGQTTSGSSGRSSWGATSSESRASSSTSSTTGSSATGANASTTASSTTGTSANRTSSTTAGQTEPPNGDAQTNGGFAQSGRSTAGSRPGRVTDNAIVRWWRNQNFAWPLIYAATLIYLAGLAHFGRTHEATLTALVTEVQSHGNDIGAIWETISTSRHGVPTPLQFVSSVELVSPPLEGLEWYGLLAGIVVLSLLLVVIGRIRWRSETWGPVSIDETIVVAIALTAVTMVIGGPLLTGTVLMPLLFGVIVHRTHQLPGWSPSYLYVGCVLAPAIGFGVILAGYSTLALEIALFGVFPLLGAFGLPLRTSIRKRFGR
ncbi:J domain-containing protein [Natrialbaceae archaeon A-chndr2]